MAQLIYQINSGYPNFTAHIEPNVASDQIHSSLGVYSFDDIPVGEYSLTITDNIGCEAFFDNLIFTTTTTTSSSTTTTTTTLPPTTTTTTTSDEWFLILEYQTNSPATTTFDPSVFGSSGSYKWDLGDGTIIMGGVVSHTYADASTKTARLYGQGTCNITFFQSDNDHIVGIVDMSHPAFTTLGGLYIYTNPLLTGLLFPTTITAALSGFRAYATGIVGNLDLTAFSTLSNFSGSQFYLWDTPAMTDVTFAPVVTGKLVQIDIHNSGLNMTLDLSMFTSLTDSCRIYVYSNLNLPMITFPNAYTGIMEQLLINQNNITGALDVSMFDKFTTTSSTQIEMSNNNITSINFPSVVSGTFWSIGMSNNDLTGIVDLSMFTSFTTNASISIGNNAPLTDIIFAPVITGEIDSLYCRFNNITGTLDLSMFTTFSTSATILIESNPLMTNVLYAPVITGVFTVISMKGCSLGYVDMSGFTSSMTSVNSSTIELQANLMTTTDVNHMLVDGDNNSVGGYTLRQFTINSNSAPDSSSGGYDGLAAKLSLQGKGFTVLTD